MTTNALDVARYIVKLAGRERETFLLTPMHLQKLLYYVQGWYAATYGRPLFNDQFEAWRHGPVVRSVWKEFGDFEHRAIPANTVRDPSTLDADTKAIIDSIWEGHKKYAAPALREMTHREPPWLNARGGLPEDAYSENPIPFDSILQFFSTRADAKRIPGLEPEAIKRAEDDLAAGRVFKLKDVLAEIA